MSSPGDPFATAKANLRDTIKWLTTTLAAIAAAILAGSPLTGLGSLSNEWRLWAAVLGALLGLACILAAIVKTLNLLRSDGYYLEDLRTDDELRKFIDNHSDDLLPPEYRDITTLLDARKEARTVIADKASQPNDPNYLDAVKLFKAIDGIAFRLVNYAHFETLSRRLKRAAGPLVMLAIGAILGLGLFAWAANPPKPEPKPSAACCDCGTLSCTTPSAGGPEYLGGFAGLRRGQVTMELSAFETAERFTVANDVIERVCDRWRDRNRSGYDGLLMVIGGTDRLPLSPDLKKRYEANVGIAQARAHMVSTELRRRCLSASPNPEDGLHPEQVIELVAGPRTTPTERRPADEKSGYSEDRRVDLWAIWRLRANTVNCSMPCRKKS